jgi:hypothetical protein
MVMKEFLTVEEAANELNVPVQTIQSWIETQVIHETDRGLPAEQFAENMSRELKNEFAILQQQVFARDED